MNRTLDIVLAWCRSAIMQNFSLKVVSLMASVLLFTYVQGTDDGLSLVSVDVSVTIPKDTDQMLISEVPDRVRLTLSGSRSVLNSIDASDLDAARIQLSPEHNIYHFEPADFDLPAGVRVDQMVPASFPLSWARSTRRRVVVSAKIVGEIAKGMALREKPRVEPPAITVAGPVSEVDSIRDVGTNTVDLSSYGEGAHRVRVDLEPPPANSAYEWEGPITVSFELTSALVEKRFAKLEVAAVGAAPATVRPARVNVRLKGPPAVLGAIDPDHIVPWIDVSKTALVGTVPVPVQIRGLPAEVEVVRMDPADVLVTLKPGKRTAPSKRTSQTSIQSQPPKAAKPPAPSSE